MSGIASVFTESQGMAEAVRRAFDEQGEWPAVAELRRHVHIADNASALSAVCAIASWRTPPDNLVAGRSKAKAGRVNH